MAQLRLYLLGPPRLESDSTPVVINRRKAMALFCYLATSGDNHSRDKLATLLWPDSSQRQARAALSTALWDLNKTPLGAYLEVEAEAIRLRATSSEPPAQPALWLDVTRFQECLALSQTHNHPAGAICPTCLDVLTEAVTLYRDDFLAGFNLPDCPDFDEWQFFQTESLRQELATALERLIQLHQAQNETAAAIPHARRWLALDPLHEPAHRQLMLLYAQSGQQGAALRQYEEYVRLLKEELGVSPSAETKALYEDIKARRISPLAEAAKRGKKELRDTQAEKQSKIQNLATGTQTKSKIQTLGRYELLSELGRGGFAVAYRARDPELDRVVALKVLHSHLMEDAGWVSRFRREARAIARLDHPRIVTVHDIDEAEGRLFLVMRLIEGPDLATLIANRGHLPWPEAVEIIKAVAEGLDYAHRQKILHRDLKPANILIDSERGPLLSDFGLAKLVGEHSLSQQGDIVGTPHYIAPELWESQPASVQSDIYALGCILYELLTGEKLFKGASPPAVMMAHFSHPVLPQAWPEGVPSGVTEILKSALANQPAERYMTAGEMVNVIAALTVDTVAEQGAGEHPFDPRAGDWRRLRVQSREVEERSPPRSSAPLLNLPAQVTPFIGREKELTELATLLDNANIPLVTILGPGGMGKTRLALEIATRQLEHYKHGIYFVSLAPLLDSENLIPIIAHAVNFPFSGDERSPRKQLLDYFRQKQLLLVLDNVEHLLSPSVPPLVGATEGSPVVEFITDLLQTAPQVKLLVTSRERLRLSSETIFTLEGLDFPAEGVRNEFRIPSEDVTSFSALQLFLQCARRVQPHFELIDETLPAISRICCLVQGMPLGILLAATWVELLTPLEIVDEITRNLDFLAGDLHDLPERQRSLRAVFDYSWRRLPAEEQAVLQQVSVFRGGFSRAAVEAVTGASLRTLLALVNKSLLHRVTEGRYEIHELLRQYGAEKLALSPAEERATCDRHSAYYCAFLKEQEPHLKGAQQQAALAKIELEHDNAQTAWDWAAEQGRVEQLAQAVDTLGLFYLWRGRYQEGEVSARRAAKKLATRRGADRLQILVKLWVWQAIFNRVQGNLGLASQLLRQSLTLLDSPDLASSDTRAERAAVLLEMGCVAAETDNAEASHLYQQSLTMYQALDDQWATAEVLSQWGEVLRGLGLYGEAKQRQEESLAIRRALGDQRGIANSLSRLNNIAMNYGEIEVAEQLIKESIAIRQEIGDQVGIAGDILEWGLAHSFFGNFDEAHSLLEKSIAIYTGLGDRRAFVNVRIFLGIQKLHLGQYKQAQAQLQEDLALCQEIGSQYNLGNALRTLGRTALAQTAYVEAEQWLQESITVFHELRQPADTAQAFGFLAYTARGRGYTFEMRHYLVQVLRTVIETGDIIPLVFTLPAVALLLADRGQQEQAVEIYALVSQRPTIANSHFFEDIAGRHLAAIAATLPPEVVAAAQERGRARDLWATAEELLEKLKE